MKNSVVVGGLMNHLLSISAATVVFVAPVFGKDFRNAAPVNLLLNNKYSLSATVHEARPIEAIGSPAQIRSARIYMPDEEGSDRVYGEVQVAGERDLTDCVYHPSRPSAILEFDFSSENILSAEVVVATIDSLGNFGDFQKLVIEGQPGAPLLGVFSWGISVPSGFRIKGGAYVAVTSVITGDGVIWEGNPINILQPFDERIPSSGMISGNPYSKPGFCVYTTEGSNDEQKFPDNNGDLMIELDKLVERFGVQKVRAALDSY